jgi:hypothetical protein
VIAIIRSVVILLALNSEVSNKMYFIACRHPVFKIHYFMAVLVYLKSLSLMFHGINYHFIQTKGEHIATWAILYYVAHL